MPPIFIVPMPTVRTQQGGGQQAGGSSGGGGGGGQGPAGAGAGTPAQRTTFRPPWIKEGPEPLPMPAAPWTLARARDRRTSRDEPAEPPAATPARKQSKITIVPSQPAAAAQENGVDPKGLKKDVVSAAANKKQQHQKAPEPVSAKANDAPLERKINIQVESKQRSEPKAEAAKAPAKAPPKAEPKAEPKPPPKPEPPKEAKKPPAPREPRRPPEPQPTPLARSRSNRSASNLAPVPPPPPAPAPPPPPPDFKKDPLSKAQEQKLEKLRTGRTRKRPDWSAMMKEVEQGLRLRHVQCNDRSQPLLPTASVKGQFMYDSEKPNVHNQLLREIQSGIKLKRVKTNDRSRPVLEGLRKFRRQLTIEEQQQAQEVQPDAVEADELDDIDTLRDDLQSTKQMLALELRNKEAVEKENKRLQARILNLEVELEEERKRKAAGPAENGGAKKSLEAEKVAESLRGQLSDANKHAHELEQRVHEADLQTELLRAELEELRRRNTTLERRVSNAGKDQPLAKQPSAKKLNKSMSAVNAAANAGLGAAPAPEEEEEEEEDEEEEETETETESEEEDSSEDEEKMAALREKRQTREIKLLSTKVRTLKEKQDTVRKERRALRLALRNQNKALKEERKKYRKLQKEVDKMAKLMKEDDDEEEEEEEEEENEEEEEEESEDESSTEESEDEESEGELPADAPFEDRKKNFTERAKRHDNILAALKKGNYLLKANVEKVKDDLFKQKELSITMQEDLNSVLAELG